MKKTTKSLLLSALILFCAGLLLALSSALFVTIKGIDPYGVPQNTKVIENKTVTLSDILAVSPNSNYMKKLSNKEFLRIDLRSYAGNLIVRTGDETSLEFLNTNISNISYEIKGETLTVGEIDPVGFMGVYIDNEGFSYKGLRQIFGPGNSANSGKTVILTLAEGFLVDQIDITSQIGDITLEGISSDIINVTSAFGNVALKELTNTNAKIDITGDLTDVVLADSSYVSCNIATKLGNINVAVPSLGNQSTVLDSWAGEISITTDIPTTEFQLILSTSFGDVMRNGELLGKELRASSANASRISSTLFFGDISLSFSGGDEDQYVAVDSPETGSGELLDEVSSDFQTSTDENI